MWLFVSTTTAVLCLVRVLVGFCLAKKRREVRS